MPKQQPAFDRLFHALADPTRRSVIERLGRGPASVSALSGAFQMSLPSFVQHLGVLEQSGLVKSSKSGRVRTYTLEPNALREVEGWLSTQRRLWEQRLDQLDLYLLEQKNRGEQP